MQETFQDIVDSNTILQKFMSELKKGEHEKEVSHVCEKRCRLFRGLLSHDHYYIF